MIPSASKKRFEVALHLVWSAPRHGYTDSARYTVDAYDEAEAIVFAVQEALADHQEAFAGYPEENRGYKITSACPVVIVDPAVQPS